MSRQICLHLCRQVHTCVNGMPACLDKCKGSLKDEIQILQVINLLLFGVYSNIVSGSNFDPFKRPLLIDASILYRLYINRYEPVNQ